MFCDQCGQAMADEARFCARCGKAVTRVAEPPLVPAPHPVPAPPPVAPPGLTAAEHEKLREFVSWGLLNSFRRQVTGDRRASERTFLDALTARAAAEPDFRTLLAYSMATVDLLPLERWLKHPEAGLPRSIAEWATAQSAVPDAVGLARQGEAAPEFVLCANGHRVRSDRVSCLRCGAAIDPSPKRATGAPGTSLPPAPSQQVLYSAPPANGFAVASLVLGILWLWGVGAILALIFGYISLEQVRERGEGGRGIAIAGIVLGWVGLAVGVILILVLVSAAKPTDP